MTNPDLPAEGGCRCGRVRFRVTKASIMTSACHCTGCQHMTASAFSLTMMVPDDGLSVIAGKPVIGGLHGDRSRHHHCDWCKSWVFTRIEPTMGFVNVRATMLDDAGSFEPYVETFTSEGLPWAKTPAKHSFAKFPDAAEYPSLLAEFAALQ